MLSIHERARRLLARREPAISGSGGRSATFKAAVALIKGFSLKEEQALPLLTEWNASCSPPWTERELRSFLRDASKAKRPDGYLLGEDSWRPSPLAPRRTNPVPAIPLHSDEKKVRQRAGWPEMPQPSPAEMKIIATTRGGISTQAVARLNVCEHLFITRHHGHECFVIRDGTGGKFAQARRMDGRMFDTPGGPKKSLNLPGSEGKWLCPGGLGGLNPAIIVEGCIGALEVSEMAIRAGDADPVILAAVCASVWLEDGILQALKGRRITILSDNDEAGLNASARWAGQIAAFTGTRPRCLKPTNGCKDFGEMLAVLPADAPTWNELIPNF